MEATAEIAALEEFSGRAAGTDAERRAANHLRGRLKDAEIEPTEVRPRIWRAHALHALAAVAGSLVAASDPTIGMALVGAATLSAALDVAGVAHLGRRLTGRRASQNVETREDRGRSAVVILVAAYDAPRAIRLRDPGTLLLAAMLAVLACCALRMAGVEGTALAAAQFVPTVALIVLLLPLLEAELARPGPDPAGAAGVAAVLELAEDLRGGLEHLDLWVVLTGAGRPCGLGMRRWLRRHRDELTGRRAVVLAVGPMGDGGLCYARRQGPVLPRRSDPELLGICAEIAEDDRDGAYDATPATRREPGDGYAAISHRLPALTVWCDGEEAGDPERVARYCRELITRLDVRPV